MEQKCFNCKFFQSETGGYFRSEYSEGECWLNPPTVVSVMSLEKPFIQVRPTVQAQEYCGSFKEKIED